MKSNGFTLIELMIVVAIVAILAAMFFGEKGKQSDDPDTNPKKLETR